MKTLRLSSILLVLFTVACGGLRHGLVVTSATSHTILNTVESTVDLTTCQAAPSLQKCITVEQRKTIADKLIHAYQLDKDAAKAIKDWDGQSPKPAMIAVAVADITVIVQEIMSMIPDSQPKVVLKTELGVK